MTSLEWDSSIILYRVGPIRLDHSRNPLYVLVGLFLIWSKHFFFIHVISLFSLPVSLFSYVTLARNHQKSGTGITSPPLYSLDLVLRKYTKKILADWKSLWSLLGAERESCEEMSKLNSDALVRLQPAIWQERRTTIAMQGQKINLHKLGHWFFILFVFLLILRPVFNTDRTIVFACL